MERVRRLLAVKRWGEEEGRVALAAWRASGLPLQTFAREQGLCPQRLRAWRGRLGESPTLLPVRLVGGTSAAAPGFGGAMMELVLVTGRRVRLGPEFDEQSVARLVGVLESREC